METMTEMKIFLAKFISKFKIVEVWETKIVPNCDDLFVPFYEKMVVQYELRENIRKIQNIYCQAIA